MSGIVRFLRCIGRATLENGGRALASLVPFGDAAYSIARDAYEEYRRDHGTEQLRSELRSLAATSQDTRQHAALEAVVQEATGQPSEVQLALVSYLEQLPVEESTRSEGRPTVQGVKHRYGLRGMLTSGDVSDVYLACRETEGSSGEPDHLLKITRIDQGRAVLGHECRILKDLTTAAQGTTYREYLPPMVETFQESEGHRRRVNVFRYEQGYYTLEQIHQCHPVMPDHHLAWIFKRFLTVLGFCHRQEVVHGAFLPPHVLLHAGNHGLRLVGWGQSVRTGQRVSLISTRYRNWYPQEVLRKQSASPGTDLYMAAQCVAYLAGGDPLAEELPTTTAAPLRRFINTCLLAGVRMRPHDAWALMEEFDDVIGGLFGLPKFHELNMNGGFNG